MDNITRQNQFYETPVIKQENESVYDRRPLDMEPPQQAYRPGRKAPTLSSLMETESKTLCLSLGQFFWPLSFRQGGFVCLFRLRFRFYAIWDSGFYFCFGLFLG